MNHEKFSNPNYRPEEWNRLDKPIKKMTDGLTGIPVIDAADKLSQKVVIDSLTGCLNRSYYENSRLHFDIQRTKDDEIAIIFIDLNGLKNINDTLGHAKGDEIICMLACFLKAKFRKGDEIIRLGGDEFVIICHNHENDPQFESHLQNKIEVVQKKFEERLMFDQMPSNGFAAGVAVLRKDTDANLDDVLGRADKKMYSNKESMKRIVATSDII